MAVKTKDNGKEAIKRKGEIEQERKKLLEKIVKLYLAEKEENTIDEKEEDTTETKETEEGADEELSKVKQMSALDAVDEINKHITIVKTILELFIFGEKEIEDITFSCNLYECIEDRMEKINKLTDSLFEHTKKVKVAA